jgi:hypothetical protein
MKKSATKKPATFKAIPTPPIPVHPNFAPEDGCTLTTKQKVRECIYPAISARYNKPVQDSTKLREGGLGLDDTMIQTDLYATVVIAVHNAGCQLRTFSPTAIVQCETAGDITDAVWADLMAP